MLPGQRRGQREGAIGMLGAHNRVTTLTLVLLLAVFGAVLVGCSGDETTEDTGTTEELTTDSTDVVTDDTATEGTTTEDTSVGVMPPAGDQSDQYEEQIPDLQAQVDDNPEDLETLQQLAIAYYQTGEYEQAVETYQQMLEVEDNAEVHNNLANVYRDMNEIDQAIEEYRTAIDLDPSSVIPYVNLAVVYGFNSQPDEAAAVIQDGLDAIDDEQAQAMLEQTLQQIQQ